MNQTKNTMLKYPIGIQSFDQIINGNYVYVDKTALIYSLVTEGKIYFLGRARAVSGKAFWFRRWSIIS